jgi:hypothetical protein
MDGVVSLCSCFYRVSPGVESLLEWLKGEMKRG